MMQGGIIALTLTVLILPGFVAAQSGDNIGWNTVVAIGWTTEHANEFFETLFGSRNYTKQEVSLSIAGNMSGSNSCKTNYHFGSTGQRSKSIKYRFKFYPNGNGDDLLTPTLARIAAVGRGRALARLFLVGRAACLRLSQGGRRISQWP